MNRSENEFGILHIITSSMAMWLKCSPMVRETRVQRIKKWYKMPLGVTLSIIKYALRVGGAIHGVE